MWGRGGARGGKRAARAADGEGGGYPLDAKLNEKITDRLDPGERVVMSIRQSRMWAGGSPVTPNSVFITPMRVIIRNPTRLGLGEQVEDFAYGDITNIRLERGITSSSLIFSIRGRTEMSKTGRNTNSAAYGLWGRDTPGAIDALPRDKAEKAYRYIRERMREAKEGKRQEGRTGGNTNGKPERQDPLHELKMRYVRGEITEAEYEKMKRKVLE